MWCSGEVREIGKFGAEDIEGSVARLYSEELTMPMIWESVGIEMRIYCKKYMWVSSLVLRSDCVVKSMFDELELVFVVSES